MIHKTDSVNKILPYYWPKKTKTKTKYSPIIHVNSVVTRENSPYSFP